MASVWELTLANNYCTGFATIKLHFELRKGSKNSIQIHLQYKFNSLQKIFSFELRKGSKNSIQIHLQYKFIFLNQMLVISKKSHCYSGVIFFSYLTDFSYFSVKEIPKIRTGQKWPFCLENPAG
jgi:hypothetical protein